MDLTKTFNKLRLGTLTAVAGMVTGTMAFAQNMSDEVLPTDLPVLGAPHANGIALQGAYTELARDIHFLDNFLLWIITIIALFVVAVMIYIMVRFNSKRNPKAAQFSHNTPLEVVWTIVPVLILVFIGAFSLPILFKQQEFPEGDVVVKVSGGSWYWNYHYINDGIQFDSYMIGDTSGGVKDEDTLQMLTDYGYTEDDFLLATDTALVLPVDKTVLLQVTGLDVIHSWTIPAFGVKQDAVPGRTGLIWFKPEAEGVFFGQCSELCGLKHTYMPITVKVVSQDIYEEWKVAALDEYPEF